jgi:hypothetical protein
VETLIRNITLNSLDNVEVLEVAAGEVTQMSDLYVHADPSRSPSYRKQLARLNPFLPFAWMTFFAGGLSGLSRLTLKDSKRPCSLEPRK